MRGTLRTSYVCSRCQAPATVSLVRRKGIGILLMTLLLLTGCSQSDQGSSSSDDSTAVSVDGGAGSSVDGGASTQRSTPDCDEAMQETANASDDDANSAFFHTVQVCTTAADWMVALEDTPGAGTLTSYGDDDAKNLLQIVCATSYDEGDPMQTPTCQDADAAGLLS